jgi:hypothetical protein
MASALLFLGDMGGVGLSVLVGIGAVALYALLFWVGIGLCELRGWARTWVLVVSILSLFSFLLRFLVVISVGGDAEDALVPAALLSVPISVWALWYLFRSRVKEAFLVVD